MSGVMSPNNMEYKIALFLDASSFLDRVGALLNAQEAKFGLSLGLARRLVGEPHTYGEANPWFASVESETEVCAAAMRTPPHKLILSFFGGDLERICSMLTSIVSNSFANIPGIIGQNEIVQPFAERWCDTHGVTVRSKMGQKIYELTKVRFDITSNGLYRRAGEEDKDTVATWATEFHRDVSGEEPPEGATQKAHARVDRGEIYLWCDGEPVSMCGSCRPTDHGIAINYVYTPPEKRSRGYATACVASLCDELLGRGYRFCVLYADLANPISNRIYRRIGFTEVGDFVEVVFTRAN